MRLKILTFTATEPDTHGGQGLALILNAGQVLPIVIRGTTAEAAGESARQWWDRESEKERTKLAGRSARGAARKKPATTAPAPDAPLAPVIDDEECV